MIDYTRVLIGLIEDSSEDDPIKDSFVREVLCHQALRNACEGYPWWRLPAQQAAFYLVLRSRLVRLARVLTRLKRRGM